MTTAKGDLKLIAMDAEDLAVISAHVQDAVARIGDMAYLPRERRFVALVNRFDWTTALADRTKGAAFARCRAALRFERVGKARIQNIDLGAKRQVLSLLALQFEGRGEEDPSGEVTLIFAGNAAIKLEVECIEAALEDLGAAWQARGKPEHPDDGG